MPKLFIIGTPIGNMEDITLRAIKTLKEVDILACEDTRITRKLLSKLNIHNKKLISYNDKNEKKSAKGIIELIDKGHSVGVVSDAGMPVVSDPGFEVIRQAIASNIDIKVIPGVSATLTTLVLSGFDTHFKFHGFLKPKSGQRQNQLKKMNPGTHIVFVSPHKLESTLQDIKEVFDGKVKIFLARELTKMYETHYRGNIDIITENVSQSIKGEFTMALEIPKRKVNKYGK